MDALETAGVIATCNPGGAGKWRDEYSEYLRGIDVPVVADKDEPGRRHATQVKASLHGVAKSVRVVEAKEGKDASDHLAAGFGVKDFVEWKPTPIDEDGLSFTLLSDITAVSVEWLDKPFLQRSAFHLLAGRKGAGKGTFLCGLAASITRGDYYGKPMRVLIVSSEDSAAVDLRPRVEAAGGDPSRIVVVDNAFRLPEDIPALKAKALELGDVGLVIIDPIGNHTGKAKTDSDSEVRHAIAPLNALADELRCVVIGVRHLSEKDAVAGMLAKILGGSAFVQVPRSVIVIAKEPDDGTMFHAQVAAANRGPAGAETARAFQLELHDVGLAEPVTYLQPLGPSARDVDDLLASKRGPVSSASAAARGLLLDLLEERGEMESDALDALVAERAGIAAKTVQNLRGELGRNGSGLIGNRKGSDGKWMVSRSTAPRPEKQHPDLEPNTPSETCRDLRFEHPDSRKRASENGLNREHPDSIPAHPKSGSSSKRLSPEGQHPDSAGTGPSLFGTVWQPS